MVATESGWSVTRLPCRRNRSGLPGLEELQVIGQATPGSSDKGAGLIERQGQATHGPGNFPGCNAVAGGSSVDWGIKIKD